MNTTPSDTLDAVGLYEQLTDWEGAPPADLWRLPLHEVADRVLDGIPELADVPLPAPLLRELQRIARRDAGAYHAIVGEWPW